MPCRISGGEELIGRLAQRSCGAEFAYRLMTGVSDARHVISSGSTNDPGFAMTSVAGRDWFREVIDRQMITDLIYRYCRSVDRLDVALGHSIWHEDAIADYGAEVYQGDGRGVIDHICAQHRHTLCHSHQVSNIVIELNGDRAASESYVTAALRVRRADALKQMTVWGRYVDQWSRRAGRWGLDKRISIRDFDEVRDVVAMYDHDVGRRDPSDPSYGIFDKAP